MSHPLRRITIWTAASIAAAFGAAAGGGSVLAYPSPGPAVGATTSCTVVPPGGTCTITFHVVDAAGAPVAGTPLAFSLGGPGIIRPLSTTTDSTGSASTVYTAPAVLAAQAAGRADAVLASDVEDVQQASAPGGTCASATVTGTATALGVSGQVQLPLLCSSPAGAGAPLPYTGAQLPLSPLTWALAAVAACAVLIAVGGAARLRRSRRLSA